MTTKAQFIAAATIAGALAITSMGYTYGTGDEVDIHVTDKDRIVTTSGEDVSSKYLVFTENETFENTDSWLSLKLASSDLQGKLKIGSDYKCDVYGWRIPLLSKYRNIVSCEQIVGSEAGMTLQ